MLIVIGAYNKCRNEYVMCLELFADRLAVFVKVKYGLSGFKGCS